MIFREYRLRKLTCDIAVQETKVELLEKAEREYNNAYYTNKVIDARCELTRMKKKREPLFLESKCDEIKDRHYA